MLAALKQPETSFSSTQTPRWMDGQQPQLEQSGQTSARKQTPGSLSRLEQVRRLKASGDVKRIVRMFKEVFQI
jgi:hypothetical protein